MIYFIEASRAVKIGFTENIAHRYKHLQISHYEELRILYLLKGDRESEKKFHYVAKKYHIRGEWYSKEVLENTRIIKMIKSKEKINIEPEVEIDRNTLQKLKAMRKKRGLGGMKEFAEEIGVSARTLYRWESGKTNPQRCFKKKLISIFNEANNNKPCPQKPKEKL